MLPSLTFRIYLAKGAAQKCEWTQLKTTPAERFGTISAENLRRAHTLVESGGARGKIVLEGFA
jgi:hypothetical protein